MQDHPINRERLLDTFLELVHINATSRHEGPMAQRVSEMFTELGAEVIVDDAAPKMGGEIGNIIVRVPGTVAGPALLFNAHLDSVDPTEGLQVQRTGGLITSDGTTILAADDRSGVAAIIEMARTLQETQTPHPPLELVFTVAEEVGLMGSQVMDYSLLTAKHCFVADGTGPVGILFTSAPAQQNLDITIHGRASHAGVAPERGISAITVAARAIAGMQQGRIDEETTANIGIIHGGKATNIVPDTVTIKGEARSRNAAKLAAQVNYMRSCFEEAAQRSGATVDIEVNDVYPSFNIPESGRTVALAKLALAEMGITPVVVGTGGGSDANFFNAHGIQTVILSCGYQNAHGKNEECDEEQLVLLAEQLFHIARLAV
ncbi:MAG TPA: M20/M25/M40 family metallo-hydrolase [Armatimonadota bacterium]|jgi:tripeptide aminopeptidase